MKGLASSPDSVLERQMMRELFPDYYLGVDYITDLTYEEFQEFYRISSINSYIFLYGDMNFEEQLAFLNGTQVVLIPTFLRR